MNLKSMTAPQSGDWCKFSGPAYTFTLGMTLYCMANVSISDSVIVCKGQKVCHFNHYSWSFQHYIQIGQRLGFAKPGQVCLLAGALEVILHKTCSMQFAHVEAEYIEFEDFQIKHLLIH